MLENSEGEEIEEEQDEDADFGGFDDSYDDMESEED